MPLQVPEIVGDDVTISYSLDLTAYTEFAKVVDATGFQVKAAEVKVTTIGDAAVTRQPGKPDYGTFALTLVYDKTMTSTILGWVNAQTILGFKVSVAEVSPTTASTATWQGYIAEFDPFGAVKEDGRIESKVTFAISGVATFTPGTSS